VLFRSPFDNRGGKGYKAVYPPEEGIDLSGKYEGLEGEVAWKPHHTDDEYGTVDLNKAIAKPKGAVGLAGAGFPGDRDGKAGHLVPNPGFLHRGFRRRPRLCFRLFNEPRRLRL